MFYQEHILFATQGRSHYRIPNIIVTRDGTLLAFCNDRLDTVIDHASESVVVFTRKKPGMPWEEVRPIAAVPGWACYIGSAVYDGETDEIFCSAKREIARDEFASYTQEQIRQMNEADEQKARELGINRGSVIFSSRDGGNTWTEKRHEIVKYPFVTPEGISVEIGGFCHGAAHGIQLRHGAHKGRLLCPSRVFTRRYDNWEDAILSCFNNSIYSDDHGQTWYASAPVQQGTGEGALIEDGQGVIHYNSRSMHRDQKRLLATSTDGGETYHDFRVADFLFEERNIGCNASFLRVEREELPDLPEGVDAITLFANPRAEYRLNMSICISFDDGATWKAVRQVNPGGSAYSSLVYDSVSRHFFLLYEKGESAADPYTEGIALVEFDLEWLLN